MRPEDCCSPCRAVLQNPRSEGRPAHLTHTRTLVLMVTSCTHYSCPNCSAELVREVTTGSGAVMWKFIVASEISR